MLETPASVRGYALPMDDELTARRRAEERPVRFLGSGKPETDVDWSRLERCERLAVDTESDPFHRYFEKVCLIQISTPDEDFIYDPLDRGLAEPLRAVLSDEDRVLVLHGADYDVRTLKQSFDLALGTLFDTAVAAQFLGFRNTGLKALLESELGIVIAKDEQRSDWGQRPLTDAQLAYARQDTMHLLPLAERLEARLRDINRLDWHREECELLRGREPVEKTFDPESWRRVKGASELSGRGRRAIHAAFSWREDVARSVDKPPFRIARNDQLLRLAKAIDTQGPRVLGRLKRLEFLPKGIDRTALGFALAAGLEGPDPGERRRPSPSGTPRTSSLPRVQREAGKAAHGARDVGPRPGFGPWVLGIVGAVGPGCSGGARESAAARQCDGDDIMACRRSGVADHGGASVMIIMYWCYGRAAPRNEAGRLPNSRADQDARIRGADLGTKTESRCT